MKHEIALPILILQLLADADVLDLNSASRIVSDHDRLSRQ